MHCVNHPGVEVQSYCQNCGKPLCASCVRTTANGQVLCESCFAIVGATGAGDPSQAYWQAAAAAYSVPPRGAPNPAAAAVLGLIPGVGAMYNGQLFKGLIHVVIFAVLVSIADHYSIFGIFIAGWVLYQSFEAFHTAKARRDGQPLPDPFGLNELGSWLNLGGHARNPDIHSPGYSAAPPPPVGANPPPPEAQTEAAYGQNPAEPAAYSAAYTSSWSASGYPPPQPPYTEPFAGPYPPGTYPPGYAPPIPPIPPVPPDPAIWWKRREPVWAIVLSALGVLFLLQSLGFVDHVVHYAWPVLLIGAGVWLIIRRLGYTQGGSK